MDEQNMEQAVMQQPPVQKKKSKVGHIIVFVILTVIAIAGLSVSIVSITELQKVRASVRLLQDAEDKPDNDDDIVYNDGQETKEDDVKIADEYVIRSTLPISDAYKSGDDSGLSEKEKETLEMAKAVIDEVITDDMTDYDKEVAIYKWMCENLGYDDGALIAVTETQQDCDNPYGVLKYNNAVCVGYATTFRLFMQMLDIECMVVHNTECYHSWDLVKIDDHWYHVDVYSDVDSENFVNFNQNDAMRNQYQNWDMSFWPAADSLEKNVAYQNRVEVSSVNEIPEIMRKAFENKDRSVFMEISSDVPEEDFYLIEYTMSQIDNMLSNSPNVEGMPVWLENWDFFYDDTTDSNYYMVGIGAYDTGYEPDDVIPSVSTEDEKKMQELLQQTFEPLGFNNFQQDWTQERVNAIY